MAGIPVQASNLTFRLAGSQTQPHSCLRELMQPPELGFHNWAIIHTQISVIAKTKTHSSLWLLPERRFLIRTDCQQLVNQIYFNRAEQLLDVRVDLRKILRQFESNCIKFHLLTP
jgi:hypothetical protein